MRKFLYLTIATFCGVGFFPFIPGTAATAVGYALVFFINPYSIWYIPVSFILLFAGFFSAGKAEVIFKKHDCRYIVIDEVSAVFLSVLFLPCVLNLKVLIIAFFLFRALDALKPYPANLFQNMQGGMGIMGDDLIAAFYTNIILQAVLRLTSFSAS